jgi:hypothetical protein
MRPFYSISISPRNQKTETGLINGTNPSETETIWAAILYMNLFTVINVPWFQSHIFVLPFFLLCVSCSNKQRDTEREHKKMGVKETHGRLMDLSTWIISEYIMCTWIYYVHIVHMN